MKKMNSKKGFTLAELLIVIAIIAILIAIAIPAFGSALDSAKLQTDHANMRSAYAIQQVANLQGTIDIGGTPTPLSGMSDGVIGYFGADGSVVAPTSKTSAYVTAVTPKTPATDCKASAFCQIDSADTTKHEKNKVITFSYVDSTGEIKVSLTDA